MTIRSDRAFTLGNVSDDSCHEADEQVIRGLLVRHGYDPDRRQPVCELDGIPIDGHEDPDSAGVCIHCGRGDPVTPLAAAND